MNVEEFAEHYKVKTKRDGCGDSIVLGKNQGQDAFLSARVKAGFAPDRVEFRSHVFDGYANGRFGVCLMPYAVLLHFVAPKSGVS
jgi:hypothetical protein